MRFKTFITEESFTESFIQLNSNELIENIEKNCKQYLKMISDGITLYRGMSPKNQMYYGYKEIRTDRKPRDSSEIINDFVNKILELYNAPLRNEVLFTTQDKQDASVYGEVHYVFPLDPIKFVYFPSIMDMWEYIAGEPMEYLDEKDIKNIKTFQDLDEVVKKIVYKINPDRKSSEEYIKNTWSLMKKNLKPEMKKIDKNYKGEIAIKSKGYYFANRKHCMDFEYHPILRNLR
jgi:YHS domain-containing protein